MAKEELSGLKSKVNLNIYNNNTFNACMCHHDHAQVCATQVNSLQTGLF